MRFSPRFSGGRNGNAGSRHETHAAPAKGEDPCRPRSTSRPMPAACAMRSAPTASRSLTARRSTSLRASTEAATGIPWPRPFLQRPPPWRRRHPVRPSRCPTTVRGHFNGRPAEGRVIGLEGDHQARPLARDDRLRSAGGCLHLAQLPGGEAPRDDGGGSGRTLAPPHRHRDRRHGAFPRLMGMRAGGRENPPARFSSGKPMAPHSRTRVTAGSAIAYDRPNGSGGPS